MENDGNDAVATDRGEATMAAPLSGLERTGSRGSLSETDDSSRRRVPVMVPSIVDDLACPVCHWHHTIPLAYQVPWCQTPYSIAAKQTQNTTWHILPNIGRWKSKKISPAFAQARARLIFG